VAGRPVTPAAGDGGPSRRGDGIHLRAIFGDAVGKMTSQVRTTVLRYASAEAIAVDYLETVIVRA
jgi:hypothetical protein